ncbi:glycoside hydrolase family 2, partial [bacterium]|nr:glycoside hydrolase family 2 [bacterium]
FPVESALSGVMKRVDEKNRLWYRRTFEAPPSWSGRRVLLHFGAVDWESTVWVNGKELGMHRGGYDPFTFEITKALKGSGEQEIVVAAWDPTNRGYQPRGKQVNKPGGIWYTPTTGIWQTVWLEPVQKEDYIKGLKIVPDIDAGEVLVMIEHFNATASGKVVVEVSDSGKTIAKASGKLGATVKLRIPKAKLWSPDTPHLYDLRVSLINGQVRDRVESYFGMRKVSIGKDENGITRILLNNEPLFMFGPLDQGFWPDGLYRSPTDEALRYDIEVTRRLGFNMCRKHVKIEPDRWYYWADRLGLLVWQDMPNGNQRARDAKGEAARSNEPTDQFERELKALIDSHYNHPSIVMWVAFNEGWGQYDTERIVRWIEQYDPTRLVNCASGWSDVGVGDVHDIHSYPGPAAPKPEPNRAAVLGEFGGLGLPVRGHTWQEEKNWGYRSFEDSQSLTGAYLHLLQNLRSLIGSPGLSAAVYTQTTDVEIEVNGLMTYDRAMVKMDADRITAANRKMYLPPPVVKTIVPTSQKTGCAWRYTTSKPADAWHDSAFDDSSWKEGIGGFGKADTPGAVVRTPWHSSDICIRRTFDLPDEPKLQNPYLLLHHDEDAEVYINGKLAAKLAGYTTDYVTVPLSKEARAALQPGKNTLAVHCKQTLGGQYIDVGIVDVIEREAR